MIGIGTNALITRAVAFASTLLMSTAIVGSLPKFKERRQRYFAEAATDGNLHRMQLLHLAGVSVNSRNGGRAPLFLAGSEGRLDAIRFLVGQRAGGKCTGNTENNAPDAAEA